ncbi:PLAC8-like protein 1 isoform X2 [Sorex fumeus]|uniref:PLAC8-like protein 1 isoform X2 n=1 Tax=Sorex fumeus TaxID=62283 RepID=UPI0024ACC0ED|nr:PLAC8-like protein 1 isoform X2 [Sorex fumeus]
MNCFGNYASGLPEDVSLLNMHSPLLLSLMSSEDEQQFASSWRPGSALQAVVTQPRRGGAGKHAVATVVQTGGDWSTGLFSVCRDKKICLCGLFCPMCLECDLARHYGECFCLPMLPGSTFALRTGTRERHKIRGTVCEDWLAVHCCWPFSICQVARELKVRPAQLYEVYAAPPTKDTLL